MPILYYITDKHRNIGLSNSYYKFLIFDNLLAAQQRVDNINTREQKTIAEIHTITLPYNHKNGLWVIYYKGNYNFFEDRESAIIQEHTILQHVHVQSEFTTWNMYQ